MTIFADLYKGYIKLYKEKPSMTEGHDVKEFTIPEDLAKDRMYVGLSLATSTNEQFGYGVALCETLDEIRELREETNLKAVNDLKTKEKNPEYKIRNFEYYLSIH